MNTTKKKRKGIEQTPPKTPKKINKSAKSKEHFDLITDEDEKKMYKCTYCHRNINGTKSSNLSSHLQYNHSDIYKKLCGADPSLEYKRQKLLLDCVEVVNVNGRPFRCLNDSGIMSMNENLLEELKNAGRDFHMKNKNLPEIRNLTKIIADKVREKISNEVKNRPISLLVDIVTKRGRSILGMSIQYIVAKQVMKRSIGMIHIEDRHTGVYLAKIIIKRLEELGIDIKQIISITTDNGANVLKMVRDLESHLKEVIDEHRTMLSEINTNNEANSYHEMDAETIELEIDTVLAVNDEIEDENDYILRTVFDEAEKNDEEEVEYQAEGQSRANGNLLAAIQLNMTNMCGLNVIWEINGINCAAHHLQLGIGEALKAIGQLDQKTIELSRHVTKHMRKQTTIYSLKENSIEFKKPRIDWPTRWCSLYLMVSFKLRST